MFIFLNFNSVTFFDRTIDGTWGVILAIAFIFLYSFWTIFCCLLVQKGITENSTFLIIVGILFGFLWIPLFYYLIIKNTYHKKVKQKEANNESL